jgi:transcriptional regulator with XRE-family HTH domain
MITNEAEYRLNLAAIRSLQNSFTIPQEASSKNVERNDLITSGIQAKMRELREAVTEYEALRDGVKTEFEGDFNDLGDALRLLRHLVKMSQTDLAEKLGIKQQQVQRYEALGYEQASLGRLKEVVWALGSPVRWKFIVPGPNNYEQPWQQMQASQPNWNITRPDLSGQQEVISLSSSPAKTFRVPLSNNRLDTELTAMPVGTP